MKHMYKLFLVIFALISLNGQAQNPIATLQHQGLTSVFYGSAAFTEAYNASVNGDTLVLSSGTFIAPAGVSKGLKIIGVGHYPDSVNANYQYRTIVNNQLYINDGADSLLLEGLSFNDIVRFNNYNPLFGIHFNRCQFSGAGNGGLQTNYTYGAVNSLLIEGCVIHGMYLYNIPFNSPVIRNNIISYPHFNYLNCTSQGIIENNDVIGYYGFNDINNCIIRNNISIGEATMSTCLNDEVYNNIWTKPDFSSYLQSCTFSGNYFSIPQSSIFINQSGNYFSYLHDYHLQNPDLYLGTNSTQVGIYGGAHPYKDKALPSIPHIEHIEAGPFTDVDGNLPVNIKVKPQGN